MCPWIKFWEDQQVVLLLQRSCSKALKGISLCIDIKAAAVLGTQERATQEVSILKHKSFEDGFVVRNMSFRSITFC